MKWIIDRIEGNIAVCELPNCDTINISLSALPNGVKEGDVICLFVDEKEAENRKKKIDGLMNSLFKD